MTDTMKLVMDLADCGELDKLPQDLRDRILAIRNTEVEKARKIEEEKLETERKAMEEIRKERDEERSRLMCIGKWGEKVPPKRRFALCYRMGKYATMDDNWRDEPFYCAIDLVRGYMSPYWHYYGSSTEEGQRDAYYNEQIRPVLEAYREGNDVAITSVIRRDWDFFKIQGDEAEIKFEVLDYHVEKGTGIPFYIRKDGWKADKVIIDGRSKPMTFAEHRDALRKEFNDGLQE